MSTTGLSVAQTGGLDPVSSDTEDQDACVFCNCPLKDHEQTQEFPKMDEAGEMQVGARSGRYCWICLKMCWR